MYRLVNSIAKYRNKLNYNPCIMIRITLPDSRQYTALVGKHVTGKEDLFLYCN